MIRRVAFCLWLLQATAPLVRASESEAVPADRPPLTRARVIIARDTESVVAFDPQPEKVQRLVDLGIKRLTGNATCDQAWRSLVSRDDVVGIKVYSTPGRLSGTRPTVVAAVVRGLLSAGLPAKQILIWDKHLKDLRLAGYFEFAEQFGVRVAGAAEEGFDDKVVYDAALVGKLVWGDHEFGNRDPEAGRKSYVSKLVTRKMTKIISIAPLLNHGLAGISGNLYSLAFGSVDNHLRFESSAEHFAGAIPELVALPELGDRLVLSITDALICQYQGEDLSLVHHSTMLGELWFSTDPVALDVLGIAELDRQREIAKVHPLRNNLKIYSNASALWIGISDRKKIDLERVP